MAWEMPDNTFAIEVKQENIGQRFPFIDAKVKVDGTLIKCAVWAREGKFGITYSGNAKSLIAFVRTILLSQHEEQPQNRKAAAAQSYVTPPLVEDDVPF